MLRLRNWFTYGTGNKKPTGCAIVYSCAVRFAAVLPYARDEVLTAIASRARLRAVPFL